MVNYSITAFESHTGFKPDVKGDLRMFDLIGVVVKIVRSELQL